MEIQLPGISEQRRIILSEGVKEGIALLTENLKAPHFSGPDFSVIEHYSDAHLLTEEQGWKPPHHELVRLFFSNFQENFKCYNTDRKLAVFLGLDYDSSDRRIRAFKDGTRKVPYGVWRRFLVATGRVPQEVIKVVGVFTV